MLYSKRSQRRVSALSTFLSGIKEIQDILVLKNNKGTEDNRVRKLDYSIQISKLFYERFIRNENISLFSPHDVPGSTIVLVVGNSMTSTEIRGAGRYSEINCCCTRTHSRSP